MPNARGRVRYLARLPEYEHVKPYIAAVPAGVDPDSFPHSNLAWDEHSIDFSDIRPCLDSFKLDEGGFQITPHVSKYAAVATVDHVEGYKRETEEYLTELLGAERVICYEFRLRMNKNYTSGKIDLEDPLEHLRPAHDVHADYTFVSGPITTKRVLEEHGLQQYMRPGYRFRIINTWRSALPVISDLPLAVCNFQSLEPEEVVQSDRVRPDKSGEIFHFHFSPAHRWYFLDSMTNEEPWAFVSYDSMTGDQARFCPHVTFHPDGRETAFRQSYETRNVVVTRL